MQKKSFLKFLLHGIGYMLMGNLMSVILNISLYSVMNNNAIMGMAVLFAMAIYLLLVAVPAYKDGLEEAKSRSVDGTDTDSKYRWLAIGAILWGIALIPSAVYLLGGINDGWYRPLNGAMYPLSAFLMVDGKLLPYSPFIFMGFYGLTIPACLIGFKLGLNKN